MAIDTRIVRAAIHPGIGVARVGNSPDGFFVGPEVLHPEPMAPGALRDGRGLLKRQAARFRLYGYNAAGEVVDELTPDNAAIEWEAELANCKSAWYEFQIALDIPEAAAATPSRLRNGDVVADRASLVIRPGPRTIAGKSTSGAAHVFDGGRFGTIPVTLGELRTDPHGRLLVLGGRGKSGSSDGKPALHFGNNDAWYDDIADGPVRARVEWQGQALPVDSAWVVVAPPNYAPEQRSVRTMRDLMEDTWIRAGLCALPQRASFRRHILPILRRMTDLQWVNKGFAAQFGWGGPACADDPAWIAKMHSSAPLAHALRRQVANAFRRFERDGPSPQPWPWLYGDAMDLPPAPTPRQHSALTDTQLRMLDLWAAGDFDQDWAPGDLEPGTLDQVGLDRQPAMLDAAAMDFCIADAFHPGCELTWPMRHAGLYRAPYRIREASKATPWPHLHGSQLTPQAALSVGGPLHAQSPGGLTRWMAVPWQADSASCRSGYYAGYGPRYDPYVPSFWPARVPNQVLTEAAYRRVMNAKLPLDERIAAFNERRPWTRTLGHADLHGQVARMMDNFHKMGIVEHRPGVPRSKDFPPSMQVEVRIAPPGARDGKLPATPAIEPFDPSNEARLQLLAPKPRRQAR